ncbi:MAG: HEAT repeat domain-containing protein [Actinomycetota bacterium]|nr:HEAT repeat domain-containing protein [Actinomycetota bacterium]
MTAQQHWRALVVAGYEHHEGVARDGLHDSDPVARRLALGALDRMGALTDADVLHAFADPDATVRQRAATLAANRPAISLLPLLHDPDATVVEVAAWATGEQEIVDNEVVLALIELALHAADALVREAAVAALGAIGDERALPAILAGCGDKATIRRRAVLALAPFSGPEVDAALLAALSDRDWQVRQAAEDLLPHMPIDTAIGEGEGDAAADT